VTAAEKGVPQVGSDNTGLKNDGDFPTMGVAIGETELAIVGVVGDIMGDAMEDGKHVRL